MIESFAGVVSISHLFTQIVIAFAIGGLVGLEREKIDNNFVGLRTLTILCATGVLFVTIAERSEMIWVISLFLGFSIVLATIIIFIRYIETGSDVGFTTSVTVVLVAILGILVGYSYYFEAISIAIITAFLLAEKESMVKYVENLSYNELTDAIKLGILVFILFPILPSEPIDPWGVIILQDVLLFAIFVLSIEFVAYISMKNFGAQRGLQLTGFLAGFANSFATAAIMARMANNSRNAVEAASSGLMLSVNSMIIRNIGLAGIIALPLFYVLWMPGLVMLLISFGIAWYLLNRVETKGDFGLSLDSPFSLNAAIKFSSIYILVIVITVIAEELWGNTGVFAAAFIGGLVSSAAVAVSAGSLYNTGTIGVDAGAGMVIIGIIASLTSKCLLIEFINGDMRLKGVFPMVIIGILGLMTWIVMTGF